jgi:hypothetical protein
MPRFDRTGPLRADPQTGRGRGLCGACAGRQVSGGKEDFRGIGRGGAPWGEGRGCRFGGRGKGWGRRASAGPDPLSPTQETDALKTQLAVAEEHVAAIKTRLEELATTG